MDDLLFIAEMQPHYRFELQCLAHQETPIDEEEAEIWSCMKQGIDEWMGLLVIH